MNVSSRPAKRRFSIPALNTNSRWPSALLLFIIVLVGAYFRTLNLAAWDGQTGHHPDERFMHYTVVGLRVPSSWQSYFTTSCPDPLSHPSNAGVEADPAKWEPSLDSGCSTLNPRNFNWSRGYVYGTFPTTLTRLAIEALELTDLHAMVVTGRVLSAVADLVTLVALFVLASMLFGRGVGLLAAAFYAGAVMPIQQSHFFTVDNFAVCFGTLALLFTTRLGRSGRWSDGAWSGVFIAAAVASKVNMAALVGLVFVALAQLAWQRIVVERSTSAADSEAQPMDEAQRQSKRSLVGQLARIALLLGVTGIVCFAAFRVVQPDAFRGPQIWNIALDERFVERLSEARLTANGTIDLPSSHQWAARTPWLFPWKNMVLWGMGAPLGLAAWLGWLLGGWQLLGRRRLAALVPWVWIGVYFAWQGQQFTLTMRYFLPIYPPLMMFAAWAIIAVWRWANSNRATTTNRVQRQLARLRRPSVALALGVGVLATTWLWAWSYTRIYTRPYTRVAAAEWLAREAPSTARNTWELWDDPLPLPGDQQITTHPYAEEEPSKYLGTGTLNADPGANGLIYSLSQADYVVLTSARVYGSVVRVPQRFPATIRYYEALFDGSLGFELAADLHSYPSLFGLPINDQSADEAFWVYDHPRVLIFRKTSAFSPERARQVLLDGIAWDEVYRGLRPEQINAAPTALQLTARAWEQLRSTDTRYLFDGRIGTLPAAGLWLLSIELLALAAIGFLWRLRLPLPDRGLSLARMFGLIGSAALPAVLGATQQIALSRGLLALVVVLLLGGGLWNVWRERHGLWRFVQDHSTAVGTAQLVYGSVWIGSFLLTRGADQLVSLRAARWTALVRSATLPPLDPLFAGGHEPTPYAARLLFALLDKLLGIEPSMALQLAVPTALALAAVALWSIAYNSLRGGFQRQHGALLATLVALMLLGPGIAFGGMEELSLLHAVRQLDLDVLGLTALTASALALGMVFWHRPRGERRWVPLACLTIMLALVSAHSILVAVSVWASIGALAWVGLRGRWRRWLALCVPLLALALALGQLWGWSVAALAAPPATLHVLASSLLLGWFVPIVAIGVLVVLVAPRLADRATLQIALGGTLGWTVLAVALRWSPALLAIAPLVLLTWLSVQAWLPDVGQPRWRIGASLLLATLAVPLVISASLALDGRMNGDAPQMFAVARVLLVAAAGLALPLLVEVLRQNRTMARRWLPVLSTGMAVLLIGLALGPSMFLPRNNSGEEPDPAVVAAARWLAANSPNGAVVATASQRDRPVIASVTGLPTLLGAVDETRRVRDTVQPAVNGVIDGRARALDSLYGGDVSRARATLETYQIGYVLLGPAERQAVGASAGDALERLAQSNGVQLVYEQDGVRIYRATPPDETPPFVAQQPALAPPSKTLMLDRPVNQLPVVDEYGWNRWATNQPVLGAVLWLLLLEVLGLLAWPIAAHIFRHWPDRGWSISKLIGLLVWGYAVWLPVNLGWWLFNWWSLIWGAAMLALAGGAIGWHSRRQLESSNLFSGRHRGVILQGELAFLLAWSLWAAVRAANPDVWHPYYGGEKPFEFGFLNAILRSPVLPPPDPFFSGGIVNYYYYGLFLVALPIKAIGIDPAIGFNLALPTLFAFMLTATLGLGHALTSRRRYGWLAVLFVLGLGPLATVVNVQESRGLEPVITVLRDGGLAGFSTRLGAWFWGPSRVIPFTINEFPLWGFLFADLHPHLIALPITVLAIACASELVRRERLRRTVLALTALVIGTLAVANSWDAPTYALVTGGALVGRAWHTRQAPLWRWPTLGRLAVAAAMAVATTAVGLALFTPFFLHYRAMVGGVGLTRIGDTVLQYGLLYGPFLFMVGSLLAVLTWSVTRRAAARWRVAVRSGAFGVGLLIAALLLSGGTLQSELELGPGWLLRIVLGVMALGGLALAFAVRLRSQSWLTLWLVTVGLLVALGTQFVFVRDHLANSDYERMNTVFKFGEQLWTLWAIGAATAIPLVFRAIRRREIVTGIWLGLLIVLLVPGLVFPVVGIPSRLGTRFDPAQPPTLDGLAFMADARYTIDVNGSVREIDLGPDAAAIAWLKQNIAGMPIVVTSEAEFYRTYGVRIAANTGLPTILGRLHEDEQREPRLVYERDADVKELYNTPDPLRAAEILARYHADYLYVGPLERALYAPEGIAKFAAMQGATLDLVYQQDGVDIYRVDGAAVAAAANMLPIEPVHNDDAQLDALRALVAAKPDDSALAFGLGQRLIELARPDEAADVLEAAAAANPDDVALHHLLGDLLAQLGRADDAERAWKQAADTDPSASNLNKLGQGLVQLGRWDEAERALNAAIITDASLADPHFVLGQLYRARAAEGDRERASEAYQRYLELAPADAPWRAAAETALRELQP